MRNEKIPEINPKLNNARILKEALEELLKKFKEIFL